MLAEEAVGRLVRHAGLHGRLRGGDVLGRDGDDEVDHHAARTATRPSQLYNTGRATGATNGAAPIIKYVTVPLVSISPPVQYCIVMYLAGHWGLLRLQTFISLPAVTSSLVYPPPPTPPPLTGISRSYVETISTKLNL